MAVTAYEIRQQFFNDEKTSQILQLLLNDCLMFSDTELREWKDGGEAFIVAQEGMSEGDTVKTAAEGLYLVRITTYTLFFAPYMLS
jgi:hypothetical protein